MPSMRERLNAAMYKVESYESNSLISICDQLYDNPITVHTAQLHSYYQIYNLHAFMQYITINVLANNPYCISLNNLELIEVEIIAPILNLTLITVT